MLWLKKHIIEKKPIVFFVVARNYDDGSNSLSRSGGTMHKRLKGTQTVHKDL